MGCAPPNLPGCLGKRSKHHHLRPKTLATGVFRVRHSRFIGTNTFCSPQTLQQWSAGDPDDGELRRSTTFLTAIEIEIRNVRTER